MRFIQGETLEQAIRRFYEADRPGRDSGERSLAFRQLLSRFLAVCNTVAYAHSRGVVHRDIKPSNILLGKYGETFLVDWGLAKRVTRDETAKASDEKTLVVRQTGDASSRHGSPMGTPTYMSPEQAGGRWRLVGPASDIYSLGATLYVLLTGKPPFPSGSLDEVLLRVQRGDFVPPRQGNKEVPPALDAICRKAMALKAQERYATAQELEADLEGWLADEPVRAWRESWSIRFARWLRRHRGLAAAAAGLLVTAVVALALGLMAIDQEKQHTVWEKQRAERALEAEAKAKQRTRLALNEMSSQVIEGWLSRQMGKLDPDQEAFLNRALSFYEEFAEESGESEEDRSGVAKANGLVGNIRRLLGMHEGAKQAYRRAIACFEQLAALFPAVPEYRQQLAQYHNSLGVLLKNTGQPAEAETAYRAALTLNKQLMAEFPAVPDYHADVARSHHYLGQLLLVRGRPREAEQAYRDALAIREQLAALFPSGPRYREELAAGHHNLGLLLRATGRLPEAAAAFRKAIPLQQQLAKQFPATPGYTQEVARSYVALGAVLHDMNRLQEADEALHEALVLRRQLASQFPAVPAYRHELAQSLSNQGVLLTKRDQPTEAEAAYRDAIVLLKQLVTDFPTVTEYRQLLGRSYSNLGYLLKDTDKLQEAEEAYRAGIALQQQLVDEFPNVPDYHNDLAGTIGNLAQLLGQRKQFAEARGLLERAEPHHQAALKANPNNPIYRQYDVNNRATLAWVIASLGDHVRASQLADQLLALHWEPATEASCAGMILAVCIRAAEQDDKLSETQRQTLIRSYTEQALDRLRQAVASGYKDFGQFKKDPAYDSLRSHPEFQKLLDEVEKKEDPYG
jgi:tetratricopeptide (TPR) repeat protein